MGSDPNSAVRRIALLGGESSGKTTLALALAEALGTVWVPEYGRELWQQVQRTLTAEELVQVARTQAAWEEAHAGRASRWLICDTTPLTTLQYCLADHGHAPAELHELAQRRYDLAVLCEPDFAFVQDGARRDDGWRRAQHAWTAQALAERGLTPLLVRGTVAERVAQVLDALRALSVPGGAQPRMRSNSGRTRAYSGA